MSDTEKKVLWITGSAKRVGRCIALEAAKRGHDIVVHCNRSRDDAEDVKSQIEGMRRRAIIVQGDHSDETAVRQMAAEIEDAFGHLDVLVNSAAIFPKKAFEETSVEEFYTAINANLLGPYLCAQAALPLLRKAKPGRIVNLLDSRLQKPYRKYTAYWCAKGGLDALTRALATEVAPDVLVNGVALGPIIPPPDASERVRQAAAETTMLKRWGDPMQIAHAVFYLMATDYVTGQTINVDGGSSAR